KMMNPAAKRSIPPMVAHGTHHGSFGKISEPISPAPRPTATITKTARSEISARLDIEVEARGCHALKGRENNRRVARPERTWNLSAGKLSYVGSLTTSATFDYD